MLFGETIRIVLKPFNAFVVQDFEIVTKLRPEESMDACNPEVEWHDGSRFEDAGHERLPSKPPLLGIGQVDTRK